MGETLAPFVWLALIVIVIGMLLVEPKREPEEQLSQEELDMLMNKPDASYNSASNKAN